MKRTYFKRPTKYQPRVEFGRVQRSARLIPQIENCLRRTTRLTGQSASWCVADILADFFGIEDQIRFGGPVSARRKKRAA